MATKPTVSPAQPTPPPWFTAYQQSFVSGEAHAFLLHGDVDGTAYQAVSQRQLLLSTLGQRREVVAVYNLSSGITLYEGDERITIGGRTVTRRQRALELIGADTPAAAAAPNPLAAALAGLGPSASGPSDPFAAAQRPTDALALLGRLLRAPGGKVAVVLDYADTLVPVASMAGKGAMSPDDRRVLVTVLDWAKDAGIASAGNPIFLLARQMGDVHADLRSTGSGIKPVALALPDETVRLIYLRWYLAQRQVQGQAIPLADGLRDEETARLTAGLSLRQIEDVLLVSAQADGLSRSLLKAQKDQIIAAEYTQEAEMIDPLLGGFDDLGGLDYLKRWAQSEIIAPIQRGLIGDVPKGVLLVGPPGTGKTFFIRALAREVGFNAIALKADRILGGIVGESEQKLARFFAFVRALAPTLVFLDELDQSDLSRRGNGSGNPVAANLFNAMLQFMSDETLRGKVIMTFASNRPDLLDPALLRFGRMDAIIPVLLPEEAERRSILQAQAAAQGMPIAAVALNTLAQRTDRYSAGDLAALVRKGRTLARRAGRTQMGQDDVAAALRMLTPATPSTADYYTLLAVSACNDSEHLPPQYAQLLADRAALDAQVQAAAPTMNSPRQAREW